MRRRCSGGSGGVALITTLIMLSIITIMTVAFLALSRRERASVEVMKDVSSARQMANMALERVQAETVSRIFTRTNLLAYTYLSSTNFINPEGFVSGNTNLSNVSYTNQNGRILDRREDLLLNLANLQFDPRAPVFYNTNIAGTNRPSPNRDFRFWLDLNRNMEYEASGYVPVFDVNGRTNGEVALVSGDPEWIGVLEDPTRRHGPDNRFIGRYAFLALPVGRSLDLNFIHNQAKRPQDPLADGFYRDQGVGSWEINLAAFLRQLNTNIWDANSYDYITNLNANSQGIAFSDAKDLLLARYMEDPNSPVKGYENLPLVHEVFKETPPNRVFEVFREDLVDGFTDGLVINENRNPPADNDEPSTRPWPGAPSTNAYFDPQELFDPNPYYHKPAANKYFTSRLTLAGSNRFSRATYDRYSFYRMLGQMGMDSLPATRGRINLNYDNRTDLGMTNPATQQIFTQHRAIDFVEWTPAAFVTNAADRILRANFPDTGICITNIPLYPTNLYAANVHRCLQLAANIYEAGFHGMENRNLYSNDPEFEFPRVYQPLFGADTITVNGTNTEFIYIKGYRQITNRQPVLRNPWRDLHLQSDRQAMLNTRPQAESNNIFGIPLVIAAREGLPNFNEFSLQTLISTTRKIQLSKRSVFGSAVEEFPSITNQAYIFSITNRVGAELWNAYSRDFNQNGNLDVRIAFTNFMTYQITNLAGDAVLWGQSRTTPPEKTINPWPGTPQVQDTAGYQSPFEDGFHEILTLLAPSRYSESNERFEEYDENNPRWDPNNEFPTPALGLQITNRVTCMVYDANSDALIDFVNLADMVVNIDLRRELLGREVEGSVSEAGEMWDMRKVQGTGASGIPEGVVNQIEVAKGNRQAPDWVDVHSGTGQVADKEMQIASFRRFTGLAPAYYPNTFPPVEPRQQTTMQSPYTPSRVLLDVRKYEANDPLVHFTPEDLLDPESDERPKIIPLAQFVTGGGIDSIFRQQDTLGRLNTRFRPWGGNPNEDPASDPQSSDLKVKDPAIVRSDAWDFRTNRYENLGALGAVHRGTPWQTVYMKSGFDRTGNLDVRSWLRWSGERLNLRIPILHTNYLADGTFKTNWVEMLSTTHPTNDWKLMDLFTTAFYDNAARGLLSVNQTNTAAWAAVMGGVEVMRDAQPVTQGSEVVDPNSYVVIDPATAEFWDILNGTNGLNRVRAETNLFNGRWRGLFPDQGSFMAAPKLTLESPYIDKDSDYLTDEVVEKLPRQIMSLVKQDEPRLVVYAFGQALEPAPNSIYQGLDDYNGMVTNYQVSASFVTKTLLEFSGDPENPEEGVRLHTVSHNILYED